MGTTHLSKTLATPTGTKKLTISFWVKRTKLGASQILLNQNADYFYFHSTDYLDFEMTIGRLATNRLFRDTSSFYHIVIAVDTTLATADDRIKMYINGVQETSFQARTNPSQDATFANFNTAAEHTIGKRQSLNDMYFDGLLTHYHFIDGTTYDASAFGETDATTGIWKPKTAPSVTYGTNGFFLKFENSGTMGTDSSPNGNNFTVNGSLTQTVDTPSNVFATLNGINVGGGNSTLSNGNTTYSLSNFSYNTRSTLGMPSGKFYWEQKVNATSDVRIGLCTSGFTTNLDTDNANAYYGGSGGGGVYVLNSAPSTSWQRTNNDTSRNIDTYSTAIASGSTSILMGAVDVDAGKLWVGVDGVWMNSGNPATGANAQITFTNNSGDELQIFAGYGTSSARVSSFNFGNGYFGTTAVASAGLNGNGAIFEYDVPTGYYALNTKNINTYG
jgi:hypothetical protein